MTPQSSINTVESQEIITKLLNAQEEWDAMLTSPPRKRQRKGTAMTKDALVEFTMQSMVQKERYFENSSNDMDMDRYMRQRKAAARLILTNNRSRASVPEPTFNKAQHAQKKKEASLRDIAKKLQKSKKKRPAL